MTEMKLLTKQRLTDFKRTNLGLREKDEMKG